MNAIDYQTRPEQADQAGLLATFEIPAERLADARAVVKRFANKAVKLGLSAPSLTVIRAWTRRWLCDRRGHALTEAIDGELPAVMPAHFFEIKGREMVEVEIVGERPVIAGWSFGATLEHTPAGNILRKMPGIEVDLPVGYRTVGTKCDHCMTSRKRSVTYVVRNVATGEWKQVGNSCLQDFLASASSAAWMATFACIKSIEDLKDEESEGGWGFSLAAPIIPVRSYLAGIAAEVRQCGWVAASGVNSEFKLCTADSVMMGFSDSDALRRAAYLDTLEPQDFATSDAALAWLASDAAGSSDFTHNLRVASAATDVTRKTARMVATIIKGHLGEQLRMRERAAQCNEYLPASVGDKVEIACTMIDRRPIETEFGYSYKCTFHDADGRVVIWWASSDPQAVEIGDSVTLRGTIKKLDEWNGRKQTTVTRCKIIAVESPAEPAVEVP